MIPIILNFVKQFLPEWPEWALDVLIIMSVLLALTATLTHVYNIEDEELEESDEDEDENNLNLNGDKSSTKQKTDSVASSEQLPDDLDRMTVREIRAELKKRGFPAKGRLKADLVAYFEQVLKDHEGWKPGQSGSGSSSNTAHPTKSTTNTKGSYSDYLVFRGKYISVYLVIMLADWMQGTHMYTLYLSYGVNISALFLTGFLAGAIFAPFLGSFVDKFGRKRGCIVYLVLEIAINIMEHFDNFTVLIIGRILGGISTNLLFTAFESWMTTEHRRKGFPEEWMSRTYSMCSVVNGSMAIAAGIVAQVLEDFMGNIGPFQGAVALTAVALVMVLGWDENYGEEEDGDHNSSSLRSQFIGGWTTTMSDSRILRIGLTQALSEGAMYTFVFMWVPTLLSLDPPGGLPTGAVFSSLMMAITIGGMAFPYLKAGMTKFVVAKEGATESCASLVYLLASLSMAVPVLCLGSTSMSSASYCQEIILASFLVVEFCVGLFMPVAGTLRSKYVPDSMQGAILNIFRLPLNAVVVAGTFATDHLESALVYKCVSGCFFLAAVIQASMIPRPSSLSKKAKAD